MNKKDMNMNKLFKATAGIVCCGLLLVGCGNSGGSSASDNTYTDFTNNQPTAPVVTDEDNYVTSVRGASNGNSIIDSSSDSSLISAGQTVCNSLDEGLTVEQVFNSALETASNQSDPSAAAYAYGVVIGAAVGTLCPEYYSEARQFLNG